MSDSVDDVGQGVDDGRPFSFRSGSWLGKALALGMVVAFAAAVIAYWQPQRTAIGMIGVALLIAMALASAIWWRVRVDPRRRRVTRLAVLLGLVPVVWRSVQAEQLSAVRLYAHRRARRWHDLWYVSLVRRDGRLITLDWQTVSRSEQPAAAWRRAQRIGAALGLPVENKGVTHKD